MINTAISQVSQAVQQNAAASEELASTSEEVNAQARELRAMMSIFTSDGSLELDDAPARRTPVRNLPAPPLRAGHKETHGGEFTRF